MTNLGHMLFYTGVSKDKNGGCNLQNQCMAIGNGVSYKKLKNNPVLTGAVMPEGFSHIDFRDPKVWEEDGIYYMLTCSRDAQNKGMIALFSNSEIHQYLEKTELTEQETEAFEKAAGCWKHEGVFAEHMERLGSVWECPDYFRLDGKDVLLFIDNIFRFTQAGFHHLMYRHREMNCITVIMRSMLLEHMTMQKSSFKWDSHILLIKVWIFMHHRRQNFRMEEES